MKAERRPGSARSTAAIALALWLSAALVFPLAADIAPATLAGAIEEILATPAAQRSFWGIYVVEVGSGRPLYELNAEKLFVPASNQKLLSTALAVSRLGPEYRYETSLTSEGTLDQAGVLSGDLVLLGGGDPNLSARVLPYNPARSFGRDLLAPLSELADQAVRSGLKRVAGSIIGDDTRYVRQFYGDGWSIDDAKWGYGAPISALSFNDNLVTLRIVPGEAAGRPARVKFEPDIPYFDFSNLSKTMPGRNVAQRLDIDKPGAGRALMLWGQISIRSRGRTVQMAVDDPALFAATALRDRLEALGVEVTGQTRARHRWPHELPSLKSGTPSALEATTRLATILSLPVAENLRVINKESQNLHAEMLLREVAYQRRGIGSFDAALDEMEYFLLAAGLKKWQFRLRDASGLSRQNLISPAGMVRLLTHMWQSEQRDLYRTSLAVAGEDGTLDWRFARGPLRGRMWAKTGTLSGVNALSGYGATSDGRDLAFSIFVNNSAAPNSYVRRLVDRVAEAIITTPPAQVPEAPLQP